MKLLQFGIDVCYRIKQVSAQTEQPHLLLLTFPSVETTVKKRSITKLSILASLAKETISYGSGT